MNRKGSTLLAAVLVLMLILAPVGCKKLSVNQLKANYYFSNGNKFFNQTKYKQATDEYEKALQFNPQLGQAYRFLGESYKNLYKPGSTTDYNLEYADKALEALRNAYELEPNNKDIIYSLGDMYDKLRMFDEAEKLYLKIIELEPGHMNNYYVIAEFYKRYSGEREDLKLKAESMYLRRVETDPESIQGYAYVANYYDQVTPIPEFDRAFEFHKKRLQLQPDSAEVWYTIGVNRFSKGFRLQNVLSLEERRKLATEAENALLKSIEFDPSYPEPYAYMKILYINVHTKVFPDRAERYTVEAERYGEKFQEMRKRQLERIKLERELQRIN